MFKYRYGKAFSVILLAVSVVVLGGESRALAQQADAGGDGDAVARNWSDFIHFIRVARPDVALSYGQAIIQAKPDPRVVYELGEQTDDVIADLVRGQKLEGLADTVKEIRRLMEEGYRLESRDPQRISKAIDMLDGTLRQSLIGANRLKNSGEYAVPQIIYRLGDADTPLAVRNSLSEVLAQMGRPAVRPLCSALKSPDPSVRSVVCKALGKIGYWHAAPYLRSVLASDELARVKAAAAKALETVTGDLNAGSKPVANYYYDLASRYYTDQESVRPDPRYEESNLWYWQDGLGVTFVEVPTAIFSEIHAMRSARLALQADESFYPAVSLWLAANLRKEARLPAGKTDSTRAADQMGADAYAKASGAKYMQEVLARGLKDRDVAVAMGAIRALASTAGAVNLVRPMAGGATPLVAALSFPDRRVRFMAADALANARPTVPFDGSELVISVLVEALRQTGQPTVSLVEPDADRRNELKNMIRQAGYDVADADHYAAGVETVANTTGVDVAVFSGAISSPGPREALAMLRSDPMVAALPVLFVAEGAVLAEVKRLARDDDLVVVMQKGPTGLAAADLQAALQRASAKAVRAKPMDQAEAAQWAFIAAGRLEMLGLTRTPVFDLVRAEPALIDGLKSDRDEQTVACAQALSHVPRGSAQQALVDLAGTHATQAVRIKAYLAAAESVRILGSQLDEARSAAIVDMVNSAAPEELRDAASELLGALDLPSEQIKSLIVRAKGHD